MENEGLEREIMCPVRSTGGYMLCRQADCAWWLCGRCAVVAIGQWANFQRERIELEEYRAEVMARRNNG